MSEVLTRRESAKGVGSVACDRGEAREVVARSRNPRDGRQFRRRKWVAVVLNKRRPECCPSLQEGRADAGIDRGRHASPLVGGREEIY